MSDQAEGRSASESQAVALNTQERRVGLRPQPRLETSTGSSAETTSAGVPVRTALRDVRRLSAALGPLMTRAPRPEYDVDVEATVESMMRSACTGAARLPVEFVPRAGERRWLRAVLVRESGIQMPLWQQTLHELSRLLRRGSAFRSVRQQVLATDGKGSPILADLSNTHKQSASHRRWHHDEVIVVASDFVSPAWQDGRFAECVNAWGATQQVLLLHLLPRRLWGHTWTGLPDLRASGQVPGGPSSSMLTRRPVKRGRRTAAGAGDPARAVALAGIDPGDIGRWAQVAVARPGRCDAVSIPGRHGPMLQWPPAGSKTEATLSLRDKTEAFKARASPQARQLARCLSFMAPLTLPMMQWAGAALVSDCDAGHVAEFFLGNLLHPVEVDAGGETVFDLPDETRAYLSQGMPMSEALAIIRIVGDRLMLAHGLDGDALMQVSMRPLDELPVEATDLRAFASVTRAFLVRAGRLKPDGSSTPTLQKAQAAQTEEAGSAPASLPAQEQSDRFLNEQQLIVAVRTSGRISSEESPSSVLSIFRTPQQHTALVFTHRSVVIVLDDADTRRSGLLVQRVMTHAQALPARATIERGASTVRFGRLDGRWYYSTGLFKAPADLEGAIAREVKVASGLTVDPKRFDESAQAVLMVLGLGAKHPDLHRAVNTFQDWLHKVGRLGPQDLITVRDGRWSSLREALQRTFQVADTRRAGAQQDRRLYICFAGPVHRLGSGDISLLFGTASKDDISSTALEDFEGYLIEQLDRLRYSEIVLFVDGSVQNGASDLARVERAIGRGEPVHRSGKGAYLRLMQLHAARPGRHALMERVARHGADAPSPPPLHWMTTELVRRLESDSSGSSVGPSMQRLNLRHFGIRSDSAETVPTPASGLQLVGSQIAQFAGRMPLPVREAVTNSLLVAQAMAAAHVANDKSADWYEHYIGTLKSLGWWVDSMSTDTAERRTPFARLHEELAALLAAQLGPQQATRADLFRLLEGLKEAEVEKPWLQLFQREARTVRGAQFQIGTVDLEAQSDLVRLDLLMVDVEARRKLTHVLFMRLDQGDMQARVRKGRLQISIPTLEAVSGSLRARVRTLGLETVTSIEV